MICFSDVIVLGFRLKAAKREERRLQKVIASVETSPERRLQAIRDYALTVNDLSAAVRKIEISDGQKRALKP